MQGILTNLRSTVIAGFVLTLILFIIVGGLIDGGFAFDRAWVAAIKNTGSDWNKPGSRPKP